MKCTKFLILLVALLVGSTPALSRESLKLILKLDDVIGVHVQQNTLTMKISQPSSARLRELTGGGIGSDLEVWLDGELVATFAVQAEIDSQVIVIPNASTKLVRKIESYRIEE